MADTYLQNNVSKLYNRFNEYREFFNNFEKEIGAHAFGDTQQEIYDLMDQLDEKQFSLLM
jgi:hypothetical protein